MRSLGVRRTAGQEHKGSAGARDTGGWIDYASMKNNILTRRENQQTNQQGREEKTRLI